MLYLLFIALYHVSLFYVSTILRQNKIQYSHFKIPWEHDTLLFKEKSSMVAEIDHKSLALCSFMFCLK